MQVLNFLLSPFMVKNYLFILIIFGLYKCAEAEKKYYKQRDQEPEDIEAHVAGIDQAETTDQAIKQYSAGSKYNELRSQAFVNKMAALQKEPPLS